MCCACAGSYGMCRSSLMSIEQVPSKCHEVSFYLNNSATGIKASEKHIIMPMFWLLSMQFRLPSKTHFTIFWNRRLHLERLVWIDVPLRPCFAKAVILIATLVWCALLSVKDLSGDSLRSPLNLIFNLCVESSSCMNISVYPFKEPSIKDVFNVLDFFNPSPLSAFLKY